MDPTTQIFGIAVAAVTRLGSLEAADSDADDTATDLKTDLDAASKAAFSVGPNDLWKAYTLLSRAVGALTTALTFTHTSALSSDPKLARLLAETQAAVSRSEQLAGLVPTTPETATPEAV